MLTRIAEKPADGRLVYRSSDYSLDVEPRRGTGLVSLLVNDVQIGVDEDGTLLHVWGYCPRESWKQTRLDVPTASPSKLRMPDIDIVPGASKRLNPLKRWDTAFDASSGWLCIGNASSRGEAVAFAPGAIAVVENGELAALWLHPQIKS
jgi:hypothetical protein